MTEYNPSKIIKDGNTYNFRDTTKIPLAGSNAISGSLIPSTDGTVNLGGSSYQWNNLYAKNYFYNGTEFQSKFVTADTVQTVNGVKTFTAYVESIGSSVGDEYSSNTRTNLWLMGNRDTKDISGILFDTYRQNTAQGTGIHILGISIKENSVRYEGCRWGWYWDNALNGYSFDFKPTTQGANQALKHNLGTSADKWDTLNGLNPGALSLPSSNYINVDTTNWVLDGTPNIFTPASDGWLGIQATDTVYDQMHYVFVGRTGDGNTYYQQNVLSPINALWNGEYHGCVFIPVIKNINYDIRCICSSITATFYPCQGNV